MYIAPLAALFLAVTVARGANWAYTGSDAGPSDWESDYPWCSGERQSPVDIEGRGKAEIDESYGSKTRNEPHPSLLLFGGAYINGPGGRVGAGGIVSNNGHTIRYGLPENVTANITGGALTSETFQLDQFHVHFGSDDSRGSEHTVDGQHYPAEVHFVHRNTKYRDLATAIVSDNGLAVIGVFLEIGSVSNPEIEELKLEALRYNGMEHSVNSLFLNNLLPTSPDYYTYEGSLTTPPCDENVRWIVMRQPISVTSKQLWALRRININKQGEGSDVLMENNFRPIQPLNGRKIEFFSESKTEDKIKWWVWLLLSVGCLIALIIVIGLIASGCKCQRTNKGK